MPDPVVVPPSRRTPPKLPRPAPAPVVRSGVVDALARRVAAAGAAADPTRSARTVEDFWRTVAARTPLVEPAADDARSPTATGHRTVTFLWRDAAAEQVLLFVNRLTDERDLDASLMERVPGTDVWHLSYRMEADWRASYAFVPRAPGERAPWLGADDQVAVRAALDQGVADPRNPRTTRNRSGVTQSVVELPAAPSQHWLERRAGTPRGSVTPCEAPGGRRAWVYAPALAGAPTPLLVVLDGDVWTGAQDLPTTLDNLTADGAVPPVHAVLLDAGDRERRWAELDERGGLDDYLAGPLLDWARATLPVTDRREDVVVVGQSLGALTALRALVRHPGRVGAALSQSASLWQESVLDDAARADLRGTRAYLEVGRQEWVLQPRHAPFAALLGGAGADVALVEFNGGHDYACWRGGVADGLRHLLGRRDRARNDSRLP
ncbi:enterochelin esterase domain-containing protein [Luteimicrobium xylanilyticum]|uniref:enterochelin esterase domain-containing protein n=1 Tax=Luteimicrobium xylanilyticum TaxID=1133546 RepID=UPI00188378C4|nr:enterochelin esterase domain-containing protein [Luteimicrobium xylanilyticum]